MSEVTTDSTPGAAPGLSGRTIGGHPSEIWVLFFAEMWERFSYYGMRALLVLYLTKQLFYSDEDAFAVYGAYTAMVYLTPLFGGLLADRVLGLRRSVTLGAALMALGHFAMAFQSMLFVALALLIVGNGFFKPCMSALVGRLYAPNDPRKDQGYTIFYMGVNLGAFLAPLLCGYVGERIGWHWGFSLAGFGMVAGLINFRIYSRRFVGVADAPDPDALQKRILPGLDLERAVYVGSFGLVAVAWWMVSGGAPVGNLLIASGILVTIAIALFLVWKCTFQESMRVLVAFVLTFFAVTFWAFFEQAGSSINLFTDRNVDRDLLGWNVPTTWFQSVNAVFIILLAIPFSLMWGWLGKRRLEPNTPVKFGLGIIQLGLGFLALWYGASTADAGLSGLFWLVLGYFLHTTGELCVSPVGLSMISKLSPAKILGLMMGVWYLGISFAQYVAALIATLTGSSSGGEAAAGGTPAATETVMIYGEVFFKISLVAVGVGVVVLILSPLLRRGMGGFK